MPIRKLKAFPRGRPHRAPTSHQERSDRPISQDSARKVSKSWNRKRPRWSQVLHKKGEGRTRWLHVRGRLPSGAVSPGRARPIRAGAQPPLTPCPPPIPHSPSPSRAAKATAEAAPACQQRCPRAVLPGGGTNPSPAEVTRSHAGWAPRAESSTARADAAGLVSSL